MFPLAHSNYRDIYLFWKSPVSTHYSAIFSKNACIYIILKKYLLSKQIWNFFSLSGEQWSRPTHNSTCANCLADSPYSQQVYSPNFIFLPFLHPLEIYLISSSFLIFLLISPFVIQQVPYWEFFFTLRNRILIFTQHIICIVISLTYKNWKVNRIPFHVPISFSLCSRHTTAHHEDGIST